MEGQRAPIGLAAQPQQVGRGLAGPVPRLLVGSRRGAEAALQHLRVDDTGVEGHRRQASREFLRERLSQALDAVLGTAVRGDFRGSGASPAGAEVDDDAGTSLDHRRQESRQHVERAFDVDVDDLRELLGRNFPQGGVAVDEAGVIEQQIGRAVFGEHSFGKRSDLLAVADVDAFGARGAHHGYVQPAQLLGQREPQAPAAAGQHADPAHDFISAST